MSSVNIWVKGKNESSVYVDLYLAKVSQRRVGDRSKIVKGLEGY